MILSASYPDVPKGAITNCSCNNSGFTLKVVLVSTPNELFG